MNIPVHHTAKDAITICLDGTSQDFFATINRELVDVVEACALMSIDELAQLGADIMDILVKVNLDAAKDIAWKVEVAEIQKEIEG